MFWCPIQASIILLVGYGLTPIISVVILFVLNAYIIREIKNKTVWKLEENISIYEMQLSRIHAIVHWPATWLSDSLTSCLALWLNDQLPGSLTQWPADWLSDSMADTLNEYTCMHSFSINIIQCHVAHSYYWVNTLINNLPAVKWCARIQLYCREQSKCPIFWFISGRIAATISVLSSGLYQGELQPQ